MTSTALDSHVLTSDETELLLAFESVRSLADLAAVMGRDHSVISRQLKRISEKMPVAEKKGGKWTLTDAGKELNLLTRTTIAAQRSLSQSRQSLRIGTNREFAARVLGPQFAKISALFPGSRLHVNVYEQGTEAALLNGQIEIALDCDRPNDPDIAYKLITDEPIIAVCNKAFAREHRPVIESGEYHTLPHLLCERLHPTRIFAKSENQMNVVARFNDIAVTRAVCLQGTGWALLPRYAVQRELDAKELVQLDPERFGKSRYGVWWSRRRGDLKETAGRLMGWLQGQAL